MQIFDKGTIENFANKIDEKVIENTFSKVSYILSNTMNDIQKKSAFINNDYEIIPVNEFFNNAIISSSTLDVFLVLNNSQIEFNTVKLIKNKFRTFWNRVKNAWKFRKKHKKKKQKYIQKNDDLIIVDRTNYSIINFQKDIVNTLCNYITAMSVVTFNNGILQVIGDDLPFPLRIFVVINKGGSYNYYLYNKNNFFNIDFKNRKANMEFLYNEYGEDFIKLIRIFSAIYYNINEVMPNTILIESLIANLPKETYKRINIYDKYIYAINFFANTKLKNLISILDFTTPILNEKIINTSYMQLHKFIDEIVKYTKNNKN